MTEQRNNDYEATTGHAITCTAAFTDICDCGPTTPTPPQDGLSGPQGGPEGLEAGAESPDGPNGAQEGVQGREKTIREHGFHRHPLKQPGAADEQTKEQ